MIKDKQKILDTLKETSFNPRDVVILEEEPPCAGKTFCSEENSYKLKITKYTPNRVEISLDNKHPGFLILLDTYYPGWHAYLDNKPVKIYRADYLFRAVYIPAPGKHTVVFKYRPLTFIIGGIITILTLIGCAIGLWRVRKK